MLNPTLVKLNMYNLSQLWTNSKWILLDGEYIRDISQNNLLLLYLLFFGSISISTFPFKPFFYREYIFWCNDFLSFWVTSTQFIFFCPFKKDYMQNFVWKDNNQNFKFYSISPLGRNRIKHLSSTSKLHHRWAETELMYRKQN